MPMTRIIHMISGPRNLSTAMMYAFGNRKDCAVVDEPFYAYYLANTDVAHPGNDEVLASQSQDHEVVIRHLRKQKEQPYLFVKNMAHHLIMDDWLFFSEWTNLLLIRDPKQLIASFAKQIEQPTLRDIGIKKEWEIFEYLKSQGKTPIVLDSGTLLEDPKAVMTKLSRAMDIPFDKAMLRWEAGARAEDGVWAKYWYHGVHQSTHFAPRKTSQRELPGYLEPLLEEAMPYYKTLLKEAIKM